jgi:hypothetical protein
MNFILGLVHTGSFSVGDDIIIISRKLPTGPGDADGRWRGGKV